MPTSPPLRAAMSSYVSTAVLATADPTQAGTRSAVETHVARTDAALWVIAPAAWHGGWPERIRSPRLVLAHVWEGVGV
jgi:hypothetical protein